MFELVQMLPMASEDDWRQWIINLRHGKFPSGFDLKLEKTLIKKLMSRDPNKRPTLLQVINSVNTWLERGNLSRLRLYGSLNVLQLNGKTPL